jgi:hypothetical protein
MNKPQQPKENERRTVTLTGREITIIGSALGAIMRSYVGNPAINDLDIVQTEISMLGARLYGGLAMEDVPDEVFDKIKAERKAAYKARMALTTNRTYDEADKHYHQAAPQTNTILESIAENPEFKAEPKKEG